MHVHAPLEAVMTRNWVTERHKEYTAPVGGQWPRQPGLCKERGVRMRGRTGQDSGWPDCLAPGVSRRPHTEAAVNTCLCCSLGLAAAPRSLQTVQMFTYNDNKIPQEV